MKLLPKLILVIACAALLASAHSEDSWDEETTGRPVSQLNEIPEIEEATLEHLEQEAIFADASPVPGGDAAEPAFPEGGKRITYITRYLNRVYTQTCGLPAVTTVTVDSVTSQVTAGKEYTAACTVDGEKKSVTFQRLLDNKKHPNESPDHTRVRLRDLFKIGSISPHPCPEKLVTLADETEPAAQRSYGLNMPSVVHYERSLVSEEERAGIPTDWDWRDHITNKHAAKAAKVQNQGSCGSCWAFAASATMAYQLNIKSKGRYDAQPSPQVGMSCAAQTKKSDPCKGGWMKWMYAEMAKTGLPGAWATPYLGKMGQCANSPKSVEYFAKGAPYECKDKQSERTCSAWKKSYTCKHGGVWPQCAKTCGCPIKASTEYKGEADMVAEVYKNGPSAVCLAAVGGFGRYKTGVYTPTADEQTKSMNHALVLVGFGTMGGKKYWLIQNSWGAGWGDKGFIKLERGKDALKVESCGISSGYVDVTTKAECLGKPICQNGGAYKQDCSCECAAGYSGATCSSCQKSCSGAQYTGTASVSGGKCQCSCAAGYHSMHNLKGYSDCAVKLTISSAGAFAFSKVGTAPADKIQNVKYGDILVAVAKGDKPWTAAGGWNTKIMAPVCGVLRWPATPCPSSQGQLQGMTARQDVYFVKHNGKNEFGQDKGFGNDFMLLENVSSGGNSNPTPSPRPAPSPPAPSPAGGGACKVATQKAKAACAAEKPSPTPAPRPAPAPAPNTNCKDGNSSCAPWDQKYKICSLAKYAKYQSICAKTCKKC